MCNFLSAIVTKNDFYYNVFEDSHEKIIERYRLNDNGCDPEFVRVEITPQDGTIGNINIDNWKLRVDQDYTPDWFDVREVEILAKKELQRVFDKYFVVDASLKILEDRKIRVLFNSKVERLKNTLVTEMFGSSQVTTMCGSSQVTEMFGSSQVKKGNEIITPNKCLKIRIWKETK